MCPGLITLGKLHSQLFHLEKFRVYSIFSAGLDQETQLFRGKTDQTIVFRCLWATTSVQIDVSGSVSPRKNLYPIFSPRKVSGILELSAGIDQETELFRGQIDQTIVFRCLRATTSAQIDVSGSDLPRKNLFSSFSPRKVSGILDLFSRVGSGDRAFPWSTRPNTSFSMSLSYHECSNRCVRVWFT